MAKDKPDCGQCKRLGRVRKGCYTCDISTIKKQIKHLEYSARTLTHEAQKLRKSISFDTPFTF